MTDDKELKQKMFEAFNRLYKELEKKLKKSKPKDMITIDFKKQMKRKKP